MAQVKLTKEQVDILTEQAIKAILQERGVPPKGKVRFEMTGSPTEDGFNTKQDFLGVLDGGRVEHSSIANADVLVVGSQRMDVGTSNKMKKASALGKKMMSYKQFASKFGNKMKLHKYRAELAEASVPSFNTGEEAMQSAQKELDVARMTLYNIRYALQRFARDYMRKHSFDTSETINNITNALFELDTAAASLGKYDTKTGSAKDL